LKVKTRLEPQKNSILKKKNVKEKKKDSLRTNSRERKRWLSDIGRRLSYQGEKAWEELDHGGVRINVCKGKVFCSRGHHGQQQEKGKGRDRGRIVSIKGLSAQEGNS